MATTMTTSRRVTGLAVIALLVGAAVVLLVREPTPLPGEPGSDGVVEVTMRDYRFDTPEIVLPTGEPVALRFVNDDEVSHHLTFGRGLVEEDRRAVGFEDDLLEGLEVRVTPSGAEVDAPPPTRGTTVLARGGETITIEMTLPEDRRGTWEVGCFTGRGCHYRAGLGLDLVVE